jgi:hypothetical protein
MHFLIFSSGRSRKNDNLRQYAQVLLKWLNYLTTATYTPTYQTTFYVRTVSDNSTP